VISPEFDVEFHTRKSGNIAAQALEALKVRARAASGAERQVCANENLIHAIVAAKIRAAARSS